MAHGHGDSLCPSPLLLYFHGILSSTRCIPILYTCTHTPSLPLYMPALTWYVWVQTCGREDGGGRTAWYAPRLYRASPHALRKGMAARQQHAALALGRRIHSPAAYETHALCAPSAASGATLSRSKTPRSLAVTAPPLPAPHTAAAAHCLIGRHRARQGWGEHWRTACLYALPLQAAAALRRAILPARSWMGMPARSTCQHKTGCFQNADGFRHLSPRVISSMLPHIIFCSKHLPPGAYAITRVTEYWFMTRVCALSDATRPLITSPSPLRTYRYLQGSGTPYSSRMCCCGALIACCGFSRAGSIVA